MQLSIATEDRNSSQSRLFRALLVSAAMLMVATGCGYHTSGKAVRLPATLHTIAVPTFANRTEGYRFEQILTEAVVREFNTRTNYRVISQPNGADATLNGTVVYTGISPLTYDSTTGRISTSAVVITASVRLVDANGKVLFDQPNYTFREEYEVSREVSSFFQEESPAVDRVAEDFARQLVSNVLEAF